MNAVLPLHTDGPRPAEPREATLAWVAAALRRIAMAEAGTREEPMPRLHVSADELVGAINAELHAHPRGGGLSVRGSTRLRPDPCSGGCNWPASALIVEVTGYAGPEAFQALHVIVADAARRYRLAEV